MLAPSRRADLVAIAMAITALTALLALIGLHWYRYPLTIGWDEAGYFNQILSDQGMLQTNGLEKLLRSFVSVESHRPPAYRLAAVPWWLVAAPNVTALRVLAVLGLAVSALLMFRAGFHVAGTSAGTVAAVVTFFSASTVSAAIAIGTETTLYPSVALVIFSLGRVATHRRLDRTGALALVCGVGLGSLSKTSFFLVAIPGALAFVSAAMVLRMPRQAILHVIATGLLGGLLASPWWLVNWRYAVEYARYASGFSRHAFPWLPAVVEDLLGAPFAAALVVLLTAAAWTTRRRHVVRDDGALLAAITCLGMIVPVALTHFAGVNHNMRLLSPVILPLSLLVGLAYRALDWRGTRVALTAFVPLLQVGSLHRGVFADVPDQWQWDVLRAIASRCPTPTPRVAYLGNGSSMNPPHIAMPWVRHHESVDVRWLWRFEQGPIDWDRIHATADSSQVIVTVRGMTGLPENAQQLDNAHNQEFFTWLSSDDRFDGPIPLRADVRSEHVIDVFVSKACR
jgi:hypothetical protein